MIFSWWQPLPADYEAYADAGFNIALLRGDTWVNRAQEAAYAKGEKEGRAWHVTHDGLFDAVMEESKLLAAHGIIEFVLPFFVDDPAFPALDRLTDRVRGQQPVKPNHTPAALRLCQQAPRWPQRCCTQKAAGK